MKAIADRHGHKKKISIYKHMKSRNLVACLGALILACACVPSVHPFYTEKDVQFEPKLVGKWVEQEKKDNPQIWNFEKAGTNDYKLTIQESADKQGEFEARLFKIKENLFLDLMAADPKLETNQMDLVAASLIPGHLLVRVHALQPSLKVAFMNPDWLEKFLEANPTALSHTKVQNRVILTATTEQLQTFAMQHLGENKLFGEAGELRPKTEDKH